jgi:MtN3 and saliva related transmembrane protein
LPEYLGYIGGLFTTFCYVPQLMRVFRLKSTKEISLLFTIFVIIGSLAWLSYGIFFSLFPVILWNTIVIFFVGVLLIAKLKYG